jgi:hypothetical protein
MATTRYLYSAFSLIAGPNEMLEEGKGKVVPALN